MPGGGVPLVRAIPVLQDVRGKVRGDEKLGVDVLQRALVVPVRTIAENAGTDGSVIVEDVIAQDDDQGRRVSPYSGTSG